MERPTTEIDVFDILVRCWLNRLTFAISALVLALPTGLFVSLAPTQYSGSMTLKPLTPIEAAPFSIPLASITLNSFNEEQLANKFLINEKIIFDQFLSSLETQLKSRDISFEFEVLRENAGRRLTVSSSDANLASLIGEALQEANQETNSDILDMIGAVNDAVKQQHGLKINELKLKLKNSILSHQLKLKGRIKWLREQATIARELDIAEPQMPNATELNIVMRLSEETENGKEIGTPKTNAIYLLGYRAIEAEIAADEATLKEADIIPYPDGYEIVRQMELFRSKSEEQLHATLLSSIADRMDYFAAFKTNFDPRSIKAKSGLILIVLAILCGLFIGFLVTLLRMALATRSIA